MKRLSVVIPGYCNRVAWWERCVRSVLMATDARDEIVCVDDASPDQGELRKRVRESPILGDARVRWIWRGENGGLAVARNTAIDEIESAYVTFVDSDDEVRPEVFARCLKAIEKTHADIAFCGVNVIWVEEGLQKADVPAEKYYGKPTPDDVAEIVRQRLFNYACNKVYSVAFLNGEMRLGGAIRFAREGMPCEDSIFNLQCVMHGATYCAVGYPGYVYYRMGGTLLSTYQKTNLRGIKLNSDQWERYCRETGASIKPYQGWAVMEESDLRCDEWENIWRRKSPYDLWARYRWLREFGSGMGWFSAGRLWLKAALRSFLVRHFAVRIVRRWRLRRRFGSKVTNWEVHCDA